MGRVRRTATQHPAQLHRRDCHFSTTGEARGAWGGEVGHVTNAVLRTSSFEVHRYASRQAPTGRARCPRALLHPASFCVFLQTALRCQTRFAAVTGSWFVSIAVTSVHGWMIDGGKRSTAVAAILAGCASACAVLYCVVANSRGQRRRLAEMEKEIRRQVALRNAEHAGRVKAEKVVCVHYFYPALH